MTGTLAALGIKTAVGAAAGGLWGQIKIYVFAALALAIVTAVGLGVRHYTSLVSENGTLKVNAAKYENAIEQQKGTIGALQGANAEWKGAMKELQGTMKEMVRVQTDAGSELKRINDVFAKHDLDKLAQAKPGLVQRRLSDGTARAGRLLECASGARNQDCPGGGGPAPGQTGPPRP